MLTPNEIRRRLRRDLVTIAEAYQIGFENVFRIFSRVFAGRLS